MTAKFTVLGNQVLTTSASSVTFSSIPGGYKDLVLTCEPYGSAGGTYLQVQVNGDTGNNYNQVRMYGDGSGAYSDSISNFSRFYAGYRGTGNLQIFQWMDYSATDKHKTVLLRHNDTDGFGGAAAYALRWASNSAITQISFITSLDAGTKIRLLGVN
tara:strand:+ start:325 stop:795 length:471 start_codon:yes stop_codon:yes gene_type:complete